MSISQRAVGGFVDLLDLGDDGGDTQDRDDDDDNDHDDDNDDDIVVMSDSNNDGDPHDGMQDDDDKSTSSEVTRGQEPDTDKANELKFAEICRRLENCWKHRHGRHSINQKKRLKHTEILTHIMPAKLLEMMDGQSIYPFLRLLMPDIDSARMHMGMKERNIIAAYCDCMGFREGSAAGDMLRNYTNPHKVPKELMAGDLSLVVQHAVTDRVPQQFSSITVGEINALLDELVELAKPPSARRGNADDSGDTKPPWQRSSQNQTLRASQAQGIYSSLEGLSQSQVMSASQGMTCNMLSQGLLSALETNTNINRGSSATPASSSQRRSKKIMRQNWLQKVKSHGLCPLEHKWLVRILLQTLEFGVSWRSILKWYSPFAIELWNAHNDLKSLCDQLADPDYHARREAQRKLQQEIMEGNASRWEPQVEPVVLHNTISPMLSSRVSFAKCMTSLQLNHGKYISNHVDKKKRGKLLTLRFPPICSEIKLDGERFIVHISHGTVTMQTRRGNWYSQLYSPVLGPAIRRSMRRFKNLDVILDSEVIAWDDMRQEVVPFGGNRSVAFARRAYMRRMGLAEDIDHNLHSDAPRNVLVMTEKDDFKFSYIKDNSHNAEDDDPGEKCWLMLVSFDILYLKGKDSKRLLELCSIPPTDKGGRSATGSILHLPAMHRKRILHTLIEEQPHEVEICKSMVIRPTGDHIDGEQYFSTDKELTECGHPVWKLDLTQETFREDISDLLAIDDQRRQRRSTTEISMMRSNAIDAFYKEVVEKYQMEGLVMKDLASPYVLGEASRGRKFWWKYKPDYEKTGATDIDVVILGAYFACGMKTSGKPSRFLCGCRDSKQPSTYMTCFKVNGLTTDYDTLDMILGLTGFKTASRNHDAELGKWYRHEDHGKGLPDFISERSLERSSEGDYHGWGFSLTKTYPDLWINPDDSVVLTVGGAELTVSKLFSCGLTLRFPRIAKVRIDGDEKPVEEIHDEKELFKMFRENEETKNQWQKVITSSSQSQNSARMDPLQILSSVTRFLTPEEYMQIKKKRRRRAATSFSTVPKENDRTSCALLGVNVAVLDGMYRMPLDSVDAREGKEEGWLYAASLVRRKEDVMRFIQLHGGKVYVVADGSDALVIGGREKDAKVVVNMRAINSARSQVNALRAKRSCSKKEEQILKVAEFDGILKWTFLYSIVKKYLQEVEEIDTEEPLTRTIKDHYPHLLIPRRHDFLARSKSINGGSDDDDEDDAIYDGESNQPISIFDLTRSIEDVARKRQNSSSSNGSSSSGVGTWRWSIQSSMTSHLTGDDMCSLGTSYQPFWPQPDVRHEWKQASFVTLYPDIFVDAHDHPFHFDDTSNATASPSKKARRSPTPNPGAAEDGGPHRIDPELDHLMACVHLARAMGAATTYQLHQKVTHILCDLDDDISWADYDPTSTHVVMFRDRSRGAKLLRCLSQLRQDDPAAKFMLVSPSWVRSKWPSTEG